MNEYQVDEEYYFCVWNLAYFGENLSTVDLDEFSNAKHISEILLFGIVQ